MASHKKANLNKVRTISIAKRKSNVSLPKFGRVFDPIGEGFGAFVDSLPDILAAKDLGKFVGRVVSARQKKKPVIVMLGAHVIKVGLGPVIVDLIRKKVITCVAANSAAVIHDVETALWGVTSEDVAENLGNGSFGMSRETGEFINHTLSRNFRRGTAGYGEAVGRALEDAPHAGASVVVACRRAGIACTVHAAIGTDIIHQQPSMSGAATGELSFRDFRILCEQVGGLGGGGVVMNIGSAVVLPEVFLKALTVARNLGHRARAFTTANFDMIQHYRPRLNVVMRPTAGGGHGFQFTGHHEIMIPLLAAMIKLRLHAR